MGTESFWWELLFFFAGIHVGMRGLCEVQGLRNTAKRGVIRPSGCFSVQYFGFRVEALGCRVWVLAVKARSQCGLLEPRLIVPLS